MTDQAKCSKCGGFQIVKKKPFSATKAARQASFDRVGLGLWPRVCLFLALLVFAIPVDVLLMIVNAIKTPKYECADCGQVFSREALAAS